jgi:hypothetical protein
MEKVIIDAVGFKPVRSIYAYELDFTSNLSTVRGSDPHMPEGNIQSDSIGYYSAPPDMPSVEIGWEFAIPACKIIWIGY